MDDTFSPDTVVAFGVATTTPPGVPEFATHVFSVQPVMWKGFGLEAWVQLTLAVPL